MNHPIYPVHLGYSENPSPRSAATEPAHALLGLQQAASLSLLVPALEPIGKFPRSKPDSALSNSQAPPQYVKFKQSTTPGEMAEWFKAHAWKACVL